MERFSNEWMERYQKPLLFLFNTPGARKRLGLRERGPVIHLGPDKYITLREQRSLPTALWSLRKKREARLTLDVRPGDSFRREIMRAFAPEWPAWMQYTAEWWEQHGGFGAKVAHAATLTAYSDTGAGSTTCDGWVRSVTVDDSWATLVAAAGDGVSNTAHQEYAPWIRSSTTNNQWNGLVRSGFTYDTSDTAGAVIDDATHSIYGSGKWEDFTSDLNEGCQIYEFTPNDVATLVAGDFDAVGSTAYCDTDILHAAWNTAAYNDFLFNATGEAAISATITCLSACDPVYDRGAGTPTWESNKQAGVQMWYVDEELTTKDPKLVVNYTAVTFVPRTVIVA